MYSHDMMQLMFPRAIRHSKEQARHQFGTCQHSVESREELSELTSSTWGRLPLAAVFLVALMIVGVLAKFTSIEVATLVGTLYLVFYLAKVIPFVFEFEKIQKVFCRDYLFLALTDREFSTLSPSLTELYRPPRQIAC